jgi:hypothetical protein
METQNSLIEVFEAYVDKEDSTGKLQNSPDDCYYSPFYFALNNQDRRYPATNGKYSLFHTVQTHATEIDLIEQTARAKIIAVNLTAGRIDKQTARKQIDALVQN